ncbi:retron St85 family RNA-directed DNA polymerase [Paenibacillus sp. FSL M7-0134]|uniref:retron St85 family RNA-directed DNA polymerase n=1 Tax=Paenibacillus sp. FSL M7-0134 TaxID=2954754 RepID=UPI0030F4DF1C
MSSTAYILGLPQINSISDLSMQMNLSVQRLYHLSFKTNLFYKQVIIGKKSGGDRILFCPSSDLKAVQAWILRYILDYLPNSPYATGFVKGVSILDNAKRHLDNTFFYCMDIEDFFPSISGKYVYNLFRALGYNKEVAKLFKNYCTYNDMLPQGGVTSPALSNLINIRLDRRIAGLTSKRNITFTRYADDITLSSRNADKLMAVRKSIEEIILDEGYKINYKKSRLLRPGTRRNITGLIINDQNEVRVDKDIKNILRAKLHNLEHGSLNIQEKEQLQAHLNGWLVFIYGVDKITYNQLMKYWSKIKSKYKDDESFYLDEFITGELPV